MARGRAEADRDSERSHALAIRALREVNIRAGRILPDTSNREEVRWFNEGPVDPSMLEAAVNG